MSDSIHDVLTAIAERRIKLDTLDDQVSRTIAMLETSLREHINVRIQLKMPDGLWLVFGKHGGKWAFLIEDIQSDAVPMALLSCPRDIRSTILLDGHIEALIRSAATQIDAMITQRFAAIETAIQITNALTAAKVDS